jgi:hypothetical protein
MGKDWWKSSENWVGVIGGGLAFINAVFGLGIEVDSGTIGTGAMVIMLILRNINTSEPIKQFNRKLP